MKIRKDMIFAVLTTFCLSALMFAVIPIRGGDFPYDPWADINDDGKINMYDIGYTARLFETTGTAINKTEMKRAIELQQLLEHILNKNYTDWYNGLVGYWKLDEGAGNMTLDSSGNGNNGTLINGPTWVDGKYGKALSFNGSNCAIVPESPSLLQLQGYCNFTFEAWVYMAKRPYEYQSYWTDIISKWWTGAETDSGGYALRFEQSTATDDNLVFEIGGGMGLPQGIKLIQYNSINDLTLNQWHQIVTTYDSGAMTATLYIDGILKASNTLTYRHQLYNVNGLNLAFGALYSVIYGQMDNFNGLIDNLMIYNRTLSAEEVMLHYLLPPP